MKVLPGFTGYAGPTIGAEFKWRNVDDRAGGGHQSDGHFAEFTTQAVTDNQGVEAVDTGWNGQKEGRVKGPRAARDRNFARIETSGRWLRITGGILTAFAFACIAAIMFTGDDRDVNAWYGILISILFGGAALAIAWPEGERF